MSVGVSHLSDYTKGTNTGLVQQPVASLCKGHQSHCLLSWKFPLALNLVGTWCQLNTEGNLMGNHGLTNAVSFSGAIVLAVVVPLDTAGS